MTEPDEILKDVAASLDLHQSQRSAYAAANIKRVCSHAKDLVAENERLRTERARLFVIVADEWGLSTALEYLSGETAPMHSNPPDDPRIVVTLERHDRSFAEKAKKG